LKTIYDYISTFSKFQGVRLDSGFVLTLHSN